VVSEVVVVVVVVVAGGVVVNNPERSRGILSSPFLSLTEVRTQSFFAGAGDAVWGFAI